MVAQRSFRVLTASARLLLACLLLVDPAAAFGPRKRAGSASPAKAAKAAKKGENALFIAELRKAHALLQKGKHDYKGHRARAVTHVHQAIRDLQGARKPEAGKKPAAKVPVNSGKKKNAGKVARSRETQAQSDALLRQAAQILKTTHKQLESAKAGHGRRKAAHQVKKALEEIHKALKVA
jgi:hypothetical protein